MQSVRVLSNECSDEVLLRGLSKLFKACGCHDSRPCLNRAANGRRFLTAAGFLSQRRVRLK